MFNERYVRDISRKIRSNLKFKIQKGEYIGHAPYGYVKSSVEKNKLEIDNDSAEIVREIYGLYLEGCGYAQIACILNEKGYPSPYDKYRNINSSKKWNPVAVQRILSNRVYIGHTIQGISEKISFKSKKTRRLSADKWVVTKNTHMPIISMEKFEEVQSLKSKKSNALEPHKGALHIFKGKIYCGACKSKMFARMRKDRPMSYICSNYTKNGSSACSSHHIQEEFICKIIVEELKEVFNDEALKNKVIELLKADLKSNNDVFKDIEKFRQQLLIKQKQQDSLYMDKLEGKISEDLFKRTNSNIEQKISSLKEEIERLKTYKQEEGDLMELIDNMLKEFEYKGVDYEFVKILVDKITVYDKNDGIHCLTGPCSGNNIINGTGENGLIEIDFTYSMA